MEFASIIRATLAQQLGADRFELWFDGVGFDLTEQGLRVTTNSTFLVDRIRRDFLGDIEQAVQSAGFDVASVEVVASQVEAVDTVAKPKAATVRKQLLRAPSEAVRGRRFRKFSQFVKGDCNQLAMAAVDLIDRQPGEVSPLVLHGASGVGKTHLLEAIWCRAKQRPRTRVLYLTAEQFTSYFLEALRGSGLPAFRRKYRQADVLLIDDIQFFAGKQATLVELCYTIDELAQQNRQLVLTADRPPAQLTPALGADVTNRLCGGLVCGMQAVDVATMETISRQWAQQRNLHVEDAVHAELAQRMRGDARQLSGVLNRLHAMSLVDGGRIGLRMAREAVHELVPAQLKLIRLKDVCQTVSEVFGIESTSLQQQIRSRAISQPRMLAMWFARKHTSAGLHEISRFFGRRSHSSAVTAHHTVDEWIASGTRLNVNGQPCDVRDIVSQIESELRAG